LLSVTPNQYGPKRKWVSISWPRNLLLQKLMNNGQLREKFFTHPHRKIKENSLAFKISKNSKAQNLVGVTQRKILRVVSNELPKIRLMYVLFFK